MLIIYFRSSIFHNFYHVPFLLAGFDFILQSVISFLNNFFLSLKVSRLSNTFCVSTRINSHKPDHTFLWTFRVPMMLFSLQISSKKQTLQRIKEGTPFPCTPSWINATWIDPTTKHRPKSRLFLSSGIRLTNWQDSQESVLLNGIEFVILAEWNRYDLICLRKHPTENSGGKAALNQVMWQNSTCLARISLMLTGLQGVPERSSTHRCSTFLRKL